MAETFELREQLPAPHEYCALRQLCGLSPMLSDAAEAALPRSLYCVTLWQADTLIAMGRVVGDGLHVQIVDIAVRPNYQKRGLSRLVLEKLMHFVENQIPSCAVVSLFADVDWLYQKFGFEKPKKSLGMFYRRPRA